MLTTEICQKQTHPKHTKTAPFQTLEPETTHEYFALSLEVGTENHIKHQYLNFFVCQNMQKMTS